MNRNEAAARAKGEARERSNQVFFGCTIDDHRFERHFTGTDALKNFEQPLNERIRACLRLEYLFDRFELHLADESAEGSLCAILILIEATDVLGRIDVKRELIKELERQQAKLLHVAHTPQVNAEILNQVLDQQAQLLDQLLRMSTQPGTHLKKHELLNAIRQRASIPGALCAFDLAALHHWLAQPYSERREDFVEWLEPLATIRRANELVIDLIRKSVAPEPRTAEDGFFQLNLDLGTPYQLVRVLLDDNSNVYPEISASKHRVIVRFMRLDRRTGHPYQVNHDVAFELALCQL
ncbi:cell division protein ZapD [Halothiobacillus sp.]|uniref:cell division protein ZapD n=1 Tax=Halothiobacillus sp. TaxID=1891311 RepID=UPI002627D421|nr:cell division protein ZapD [Halothiobacillus sp.]